jgi:biopolymer transport protein ExbB
MVPIGLCSVIVLGCFLERYLALRRAAVMPARYLAAAELVRQGQYENARAELETIKAPAARILLAGVRRRGLPLPDIERGVEDQGRKELDRLRANVRPIVLIAQVSPLLGLFGTVVGIIDAFQQVSKVGMGKPEMLAGGIAVALVTTLAGLAVAIPGLILAAWLQRKVRKLMGAIDDHVAPLIERMAIGEQSHAA